MAFRTLYTFTPQGANSRAIFRRLDYVYLSEGLLGKLKKVEHVLTPLSDHKKVKLTIQEGELVNGMKGLWRHNDEYNKDVEFQTQMRATIRAAAGEVFDTERARWEYIKFRARETSMTYAKRRAKEKKERISLLRARMDTLEDYLGKHTEAQSS